MSKPEEREITENKSSETYDLKLQEILNLWDNHLAEKSETLVEEEIELDEEVLDILKDQATEYGVLVNTLLNYILSQFLFSQFKKEKVESGEWEENNIMSLTKMIVDLEDMEIESPILSYNCFGKENVVLLPAEYYEKVKNGD